MKLSGLAIKCILIVFLTFSIPLFYSYGQQQTEYTFIDKWGSAGSEDRQFEEVSDLAISASSQNILIPDSGNDRIEIFTENGTFINKWISFTSLTDESTNELNHPHGIAIDSKTGDVYIGDQGNNRILKLSKDGKLISTIENSSNASFNHSHGIAIDSKTGDVYIVDRDLALVQKFDSEGNFITKWGSKGTGDGQFDRPWDIASDFNGYVYVTDSANSRVQKFDSEGNFITKWGSKGTGDGQFDKPYGISTDSTGAVYVTDSANSRVQKFDSEGNFITKWGSKGTGDGQFLQPEGIAVDSLGEWVVISDTKTNTVSKFSSG